MKTSPNNVVAVAVDDAEYVKQETRHAKAGSLLTQMRPGALTLCPETFMSVVILPLPASIETLAFSW